MINSLMLILFICCFTVFINAALLYHKVLPQTILKWHLSFSLLLLLLSPFLSPIDIGPHIELPGWIFACFIAILIMVLSCLTIAFKHVLSKL